MGKGGTFSYHDSDYPILYFVNVNESEGQNIQIFSGAISHTISFLYNPHFNSSCE